MTEKIFIDRLTSQYYLNHYKYKNLIFNANLSSLCSVTYHAALLLLLKHMQNENKVEAKIKQLILGTTNLHQLQHLYVQEKEKVLGLDCHSTQE